MKYVYDVVSAVSIGVPTVPIASEMKNEMKQTTRTIDAVASWSRGTRTRLSRGCACLS
jgi:hypothetical protein